LIAGFGGNPFYTAASRAFNWETPSIYRQKLLDKAFSLQYGKVLFWKGIFFPP